jgi:hypothetical protein
VPVGQGAKDGMEQASPDGLLNGDHDHVGGVVPLFGVVDIHCLLLRMTL